MYGLHAQPQDPLFRGSVLRVAMEMAPWGRPVQSCHGRACALTVPLALWPLRSRLLVSRDGTSMYTARPRPPRRGVEPSVPLSCPLSASRFQLLRVKN